MCACRTEPLSAPASAASASSAVILVEPRPTIILAEPGWQSPYIHADMSNAQCNLLEESAFREEILRQVNALRAQTQQCGDAVFQASTMLTWNARLQSAAHEHAAQMAVTNLFSHSSMDGRELRDRALAVGYNYVMLGENIAAGQVSISAVIQAWLKSPSHCAQMLRPEFNEVAVACIAKPKTYYGRYWVMNLGRARETK